MQQTSPLHAFGEISDDLRVDLKPIIHEVEQLSWLATARRGPPDLRWHRIPLLFGFLAYSVGTRSNRDDTSLYIQQVQQTRDERGCAGFPSTNT